MRDKSALSHIPSICGRCGASVPYPLCLWPKINILSYLNFILSYPIYLRDMARDAGRSQEDSVFPKLNTHVCCRGFSTTMNTYIEVANWSSQLECRDGSSICRDEILSSSLIPFSLEKTVVQHGIKQRVSTPSAPLAPLPQGTPYPWYTQKEDTLTLSLGRNCRTKLKSTVFYWAPEASYF